MLPAFTTCDQSHPFAWQQKSETLRIYSSRVWENRCFLVKDKEMEDNVPLELSPDGSIDEEAAAEETLIRNLEERRRTAVAGGGTLVWDASVDGEHPLMRNVSLTGSKMFKSQDLVEDLASPPGLTTRRGSAKVRFRNLARRARLMQQDSQDNPDGDGGGSGGNDNRRPVRSAPPVLSGTLGSPRPRLMSSGARPPRVSNRTSSTSVFPSLEEFRNNTSSTSFKRNHHRRNKSLFSTVGGDGITDLGHSHVAVADTKTDRFIMSALTLDRIHNNGNDDGSQTTSEETNEDSVSTIEEEYIHGESIPLMEDFGIDPNTPSSAAETGDEHNYGAALTTGDQPGQHRSAHQTHHHHHHKKKRKRRKHNRFRRWCHHFNAGLVEVLHPLLIWRGLIQFLFQSSFTFVTIPCLALAFVCYYLCGNPSFGFMHGKSTISWWLIFFARQALTLELAKVTEYFIVDGLALRSRWIVKLFGPLVTLLFIQSKGWPSTVVCWSLWNLMILHGTSPFQLNWAYEFNIAMFSHRNPGGHFLNSNFYLEILVAMLVAGLANSIKRTTVAMYFGKRTFVNYREKLEEILADIVMLTEVAELSKEIEAAGIGEVLMHEADVNESGDFGLTPSKHLLSERRMKSKWTGVDEAFHNPSKGDDSAELLVVDSDGDAGFDNVGDDKDSPADKREHMRSFSMRSSTQILQTLDQWKEPVNKLDKTVDASIADILTFRQALTYMDDLHPFSFSFGPASTRAECIKSAQSTFKRLAGNQKILSFDILALLAADDSGVVYPEKKEKIQRLFRPNHENNLTLLAFVQSCDAIYKRLRYFRASVGNSSVIDKVLEDMLDSVFNAVLGMILLTMLGFNPYPLLVSISTLLVSFAFAFGASASMYMEGIFMIAIRRPYDLGDRIMIDLPSDTNTIGAQYWFVEDINLFHTTLRMITSNEVASVNNGSIAMARITNSARSPNAIAKVLLRFNLHVTVTETMDFKKQLQKYIDENPRKWKGIKFFQCETINISLGYREFLILVENHKFWQEGLSVLADQGELMQWCFDTAKLMGLAYKGGVMRVGLDTEKEFIDPTYEIRPVKPSEMNQNFLSTLQSQVQAVNQAQEDMEAMG